VHLMQGTVRDFTSKESVTDLRWNPSDTSTIQTSDFTLGIFSKSREKFCLSGLYLRGAFLLNSLFFPK
jgi:hypothetical protein